MVQHQKIEKKLSLVSCEEFWIEIFGPCVKINHMAAIHVIIVSLCWMWNFLMYQEKVGLAPQIQVCPSL